MEMLPTVGRADVLEQQDLNDFGTRLEAVIDRGFRQILVTVWSVIVTGFLVTIAAIVAAALIR